MGGRASVVLALGLLALGCSEGEASAIEVSAAAPTSADPSAADPSAASPAPSDEDAVHLGVPAPLLHRARQEAAGLDRLPPSLREQMLERGRERGAPGYAELRRDAAAHESERVSYEGHVGLVRPAGRRLWILALQTRREGERWLDPLYVLSVVPPGLPVDGGATARIDGWVVGERTIGRNTLPLIVAFQVQPVEPVERSEPVERVDAP